jgi:D-3-phosphoglycerate dehydrogenase / 2-oxoglutarate reductase
MDCLIIDDMHESIVPLLEDCGLKVDYRPEIKRAEILEIVHNYEGMVVRSKTDVDEELISKASKLKFIARAGAGLDKIDEEAVESRGIQLVNAPEGNRDAVGEHAVGMLLCIMNNICRSDMQIRKGIWDREGNRGFEIMGKTVGVIGYGYMGQAFAKRLTGFSCKVLAYDKNRTNYGDEFAQEATLEQIQQEADIVSFHIPLTDDNQMLVNADYLNAFQKNIFLLNTARGGILKLKDLHLALENGKVIGAALDVLDNEKLHKLTAEQRETLDQLIASEKVIFSPHVAGWTFESYEKINRVLANKIRNVLMGN